MLTRNLTATILAALMVATSVTCDLFNKHPTSRYQTTGNALDLVSRNDTLFVVQGDTGLLLLDISNPKSPRELWWTCRGAGYYCRCLALGDSTILVGTDDGAFGIELGGSGGFFTLHPQGDSQAVTALLWDSTRLYMASADGISVFDVTRSWVPDAIGFIPMAGHPTGLARRDSRLFVSLQDWGVRVFNVLPGDSLVLDTLQLGRHNRAEGVTVSAGGYCIISQADSGVVVYYSPTPDTVDLCGGGGGSSLSTYATAATDGAREVTIYSADSSSVTINKLTDGPDGGSFGGEVGFADFTGFTRRICRGGNGYVYTASGDAGVFIIRE
jgi:hypothetical protein